MTEERKKVLNEIYSDINEVTRDAINRNYNSDLDLPMILLELREIKKNLEALKPKRRKRKIDVPTLPTT